jgi:hypothetical protein
MLSFEIQKLKSGETPREVEVYLDHIGLQSLLAQLLLLKDKRTDHVHLMSESWGGNHLEDRPQNPDNTNIHHVKILLCAADA